MRSILIIVLMFVCYSLANAQKFAGGISALAGSTWLLNKNVMDDKTQELLPSFGGSVLANFSYFFNEKIEIESGFGIGRITQKYEIKVSNIESTVNLYSFDIPLIFRYNSKIHLYYEIGVQYSILNDAQYRLSYSHFNEELDVYAIYSDNNFASLIGIGYKANFTESFSMNVGLRLLYGITDLKGVNAYGFRLDNNIYYPKYEPTQSAIGGIVIKLAYAFGKKQS